ncbi:hypothetical protein GCM10022284_11720 [Streptomyces hundungensis]
MDGIHLHGVPEKFRSCQKHTSPAPHCSAARCTSAAPGAWADAAVLLWIAWDGLAAPDSARQTPATTAARLMRTRIQNVPFDRLTSTTRAHRARPGKSTTYTPQHAGIHHINTPYRGAPDPLEGHAGLLRTPPKRGYAPAPDTAHGMLFPERRPLPGGGRALA